tara:strand:+ start:59 stop:1471 length:1413 start_codon:yes stop_codon:yes gene_type:complete
MEIVIPIAILGSLIGLQLLTQAPFRKVAREFNLSGDFPPFGPPQELVGEIGDYPVLIRTLGDKESISKDLEIRLRLTHSLAGSLFVKTALFLERFTQDDLEVQDPSFDRKFILEGADLALLAYLNSDRRALLSDWKKGLIVIDEGYLIHQFTQSALSNRRLRSTLLQIRDLATSLDQNELGIYEALVQNADSDTNPQFRRRCIQALLREAEPNELTLEFARKHLNEPDLEIQAWAAEALGEEGIPTLLSIVIRAEDNELAAILALRALASHKHEDAEKGVFHALSMPVDAIRADVIKALIEKQQNFRWSSWTDTGWRDQIPRRLLELREAKDPSSASQNVLEPLLEALSLFCETQARNEAIQCFTMVIRLALSSPTISLQAVSAAIQGIEKLGGRDQIALLMRVADKGSRQAGKSALRAARSIQERLGLSHGDGHLSLVKDEGGEISIVREQGELSLSEIAPKRSVVDAD